VIILLSPPQSITSDKAQDYPSNQDNFMVVVKEKALIQKTPMRIPAGRRLNHSIPDFPVLFCSLPPFLKVIKEQQ
jgi:hypothetical protein